MLIDWFTVVAQAVNFLILAWLLKRFLYGPIIGAMKARRERLAKELDEAGNMRMLAEKEARELSEQRAELDRHADTLLEQARQDADEHREQWLSEAKADVEERSRAWLEAVEHERAGLSGRLRTRMAEQVLSLAEKMLRDLAGEELEQQVVEYFIKRLDSDGLDVPLVGQVVVRTGFPLSSEALGRLKGHIDEHFPGCAGVEALRDETLGFGIIMVADNIKLEWNMASYLDSVEEAVFAELTQTKAAT